MQGPGAFGISHSENRKKTEESSQSDEKDTKGFSIFQLANRR